MREGSKHDILPVAQQFVAVHSLRFGCLYILMERGTWVLTWLGGVIFESVSLTVAWW